MTTPKPSAGWNKRLAAQPALGQVNVRAALESGKYTGKGIRVAVDDDSVDFLTPQLRGRVETDPAKGAEFTYLYPLEFGVANPTPPCRSGNSACTVIRVATDADVEAAARDSIIRDGYPTDAKPRYIRVTGEADDLEALRWYRIPGVSESTRTHGTAVASVIVGADNGIAPGARVVPWTEPLNEDRDVQQRQRYVRAVIEQIINNIGPQDTTVRDFDREAAAATKARNANVDIVNRSYGPPIFSEYEQELNDEVKLAGWRWVEDNLPNLWRAALQTDVGEDKKTIFVTAAGNVTSNQGGVPSAPSAEASMAYWIDELRGLHFAAVGVDEAGALHRGSVPCGGLPDDWNAERHGRHFCLGAPYVVKGAKPGGSGDLGTVGGTSFAAPMVAGAMAVVMESYRRQITPREVGKRVVDTADRTVAGYAPEKIGAGVLDVGAALNPQGVAMTGLRNHEVSLAQSGMRVGTAYGDSVARAMEGVELASFDRDNFPFWSPVSASMSGGGRSTVPRIPPKRSEHRNTEATLPASLQWASLGPTEAFPEHDVRLVVPTSNESVLAGLTEATGVELVPKTGGFGGGLLYEANGIQGGSSTGAFGTEATSATMWIKRHDQWTLPMAEGRWHAQSELVVGSGRNEVGPGAMFEPGSGMYSSAKLSLEHTGAEGASTELSVSQPWRAESGSGRMTLPVGRELDGTRIYETKRFGLVPAGREIAFNLRHDQPMPSGELAAQIGYSHDAGHVEGAEDYRVGLAYRLSW